MLKLSTKNKLALSQVINIASITRKFSYIVISRTNLCLSKKKKIYTSPSRLSHKPSFSLRSPFFFLKKIMSECCISLLRLKLVNISFGLQSTYWHWEKQEMMQICSLGNEKLQFKFVLGRGHKGHVVAFVFKDQLGYFSIVLDVFGISSNLRVVGWNLPLSFIF